jgi:glycosyltransferase involved in cell wall biosynthesis
LERLVVDLSCATSRWGDDVVVFCLDEEGALASALRETGCRVILVRRRQGLDPTLVFRLAGAFRGERLDVVHTHGLDPMLYGGIAARLAGVPIRVHTQHDTKLATSEWRRRLKFRLAARHFSYIVAVSEATRAMLERYRAGRVRLVTIQNGIPEGRYASAVTGGDPASVGEGDARVIGTVARLSPEKGVDRLLDAFAILRLQHPRTHLLIAGDGPERGRLESQAARLGLGDAVTFLGYCERVQDVLPQCDAFALPSLTEGIPLALLEAMAAGLPCVATAVGGVPEVLVDGESGLLVAPDSPSALCSGIARVLTDAALAERLGANAVRRVAERFSMTTMAAAYRGLYRFRDSKRLLAAPARAALRALVPHGRLMWKGRTGGNNLSLTLDDGPHPVYTPRLLNILREENVRATFFLIGERMDRHPDLVARIVAEGHEVANHSYTHPHFDRIGWAEARAEIERTAGLLKRATSGVSSNLFRPPRGALAATSTLLAWMLGQRVVLWSIDFKDFLAETAAEIRTTLSGTKFAAGDVILYHGHSEAALEALPDILRGGRQAGFRFVSVSQLD